MKMIEFDTRPPDTRQFLYTFLGLHLDASIKIRSRLIRYAVTDETEAFAKL
jgi:hypothetical protein